MAEKPALDLVHRRDRTLDPVGRAVELVIGEGRDETTHRRPVSPQQQDAILARPMGETNRLPGVLASAIHLGSSCGHGEFSAERHRLDDPAVTPAMAAGVSDHVWTAEEIAALLDLDTGKPPAHL